MGERGDVVGHLRLGKTGFPEMLHINAVGDKKGVGIVQALGFIQGAGRYEYHIGLLDQAAFHIQDGCLVRPGELRELIHAVIDYSLLSERADNVRRAWQEAPGDRILVTQLATNAAQTPGETPLVNPSGERIAVEGHGERGEQKQVVVQTLAPAREVPQFLYRAFEVPHGRRGISVADGIDPEYPVTRGQTPHDVLLTQRITIPIVAEADDVTTLNHFRSPRLSQN